MNKIKQNTIKELMIYYNEIKNSTINQNTYWIRKSKKVVLAIVCLKHNDKFDYIRGINVEVSIASGTICAERNAIGSCFIKYPDLKKTDLQYIAIGHYNVYNHTLNNIKPCYVCQEWLYKLWGDLWQERLLLI